MKYFVTIRDDEYNDIYNSGVNKGTVAEFLKWCASEDWFQLDTETLMIKDSPDAVEERKLVLFLMKKSLKNSNIAVSM